MEEEIKTPPHSAEAERGVLGSILLDADSGEDMRVLDLCLTHGLEPDSFYDPRNRILFETLLEMSQESVPVDAVTLNDRLRATGRIDAVGGLMTVESLVNATPTSAHAEYYIDIVRQKHLLRKLISAARDTERKCYGGDGRNADIILGETETAFLGIGGEASVRTDWKSAIDRTFRSLEKLFESTGMIEGLPTGFKYIDEKLLGLKPAEMIVVAARPSVGKTTIGLQMAQCAAMSGVPTTFYSLEMTDEELAEHCDQECRCIID